MMTPRPAVLLAALLASACASAPGAVVAYDHILDPGQLFSAADWTSDVDAAVKAAGWLARAEEIKSHMNERGGWPAKLTDEDARWLGKETLRSYNVEAIARLSFYGQPAILLHVPAGANQHMPEGWRPRDDFFLVVGASAMPGAR